MPYYGQPTLPQTRSACSARDYGQERLGSMTRVYYKEARGAFVVFDLTRPESYNNVIRWKMDLDEKVQTKTGQPIPAVLLGNKVDLKAIGPDDSAMLDKLCTTYGFAGWFGTSAKSNEGISEAVTYLMQQIMQQSSEEKDVPTNDSFNDILQLDKSITLKGVKDVDKKNKSSCCT